MARYSFIVGEINAAEEKWSMNINKVRTLN